MKELQNGEYLAPEIKVMEIALEQLIATSYQVEVTSEKDEVDW